MKQGLDEIVLIADRSGSMADMRDDAHGGIKAFIEDQKKLPRDARFTLVLFDDEFIIAYDRVDIKTVPEFTKEQYVPRGSTALLKAISDTIDEVGRQLAALDESERPERVLVCTVTDGHENFSNSLPDSIQWGKDHRDEKGNPLPKYTKAKLKEKCDHQHDKYKWEFVYLAAGDDAFDEGAAIGATSSSSYHSTKIGTQTAYQHLSHSTTLFRSTGHLAPDTAVPEEEKK